MRSRSFLLFACAGFAGCSAAGARPREESLAAAPSSSVIRDESVALPGGGRLVRTPLDGVEAFELGYRLVEVDGSAKVLVVAEEPHATHVRVADDRGGLSAPRTLAGRGLAGAVATTQDWLVTSNGRDLTLEALDAPGPTGPKLPRADAVVSLGGRSVGFLDERVVAPPGTKLDERPREAAPAPNPARAPKPAKKAGSASASKVKAPPKPRPTARAAAKPPHSPSPPPPPTRSTATKLWATLVDEHGVVSEARDTGVAYERPLPGMGLAAARGTRRGAYVLVHEAEKPRRERGRLVPFAQVLAAELDASGALVGRPKPIVGGRRQYGFIEGHLRPRLFTRGERGLYVGRLEVQDGKATSRRFESYFIDGTSVTADDAVWVVDPRLALEPSPVPARDALAAIAAERPRTVERQSAEEPGRVAWAGARGYFMTSSGLVSALATSGEALAVGAPFPVTRPVGAWSYVDPSGRTLAGMNRVVNDLRPNGDVHRWTPLATTAKRPPIAVAPIADRALGLVPTAVDEGHPGGVAVVDLTSGVEAAQLSRRARVGTVALVGGRDGGLWLELRRGELVVTLLDANTNPLAESRVLAPLQDGFEAVPREDGGAIVVGLGSAPPRGAVAVVLDAQGRVGEPVPLPVRLDPGRIGLAALPGGGALVWDKPDVRSPDAHPHAVVWLDDDGRVLGHAPWPKSDTPPQTCPVGAPLPGSIPSRTPGAFVSLPRLEACALDLPRWTDAGLRWFGVRTTGLDALPELVTVTLPSERAATAPSAASEALRRPVPTGAESGRACPADMVLVADTVCVDRYESQLVEERGAPLSPFYPTDPAVVAQVLDEWTSGRLWMGDLRARAVPLPPLLRAPDARVVPVATSRPGVLPSGYLSSHVADASCRAAGKRLCTLDEWTRACRGEEDRDFPYGDEHEQGACNVNRYAHPAATLHGNAAVGHLDPRLHLVEDGGEPMLRPTGSTAGCVSRWGRDGIHDMVGNLDEWVDDPEGAFAGGFYARRARRGCGAVITVHPRRYFDYSLGTRCCLSP